MLVADDITDFAGAPGNAGGKLAHVCDTVHLSDDVSDPLRHTATDPHHQIVADEP
jgi:hypothetical protein